MAGDIGDAERTGRSDRQRARDVKTRQRPSRQRARDAVVAAGSGVASFSDQRCDGNTRANDDEEDRCSYGPPPAAQPPGLAKQRLLINSETLASVLAHPAVDRWLLRHASHTTLVLGYIAPCWESKIDPSDPTPVYLQVAAEIRRAIAEGEAGPGDRLPLARDLDVLGVNTNTVLRAPADPARRGPARLPPRARDHRHRHPATRRAPATYQRTRRLRPQQRLPTRGTDRHDQRRALATSAQRLNLKNAPLARTGMIHHDSETRAPAVASLPHLILTPEAPVATARSLMGPRAGHPAETHRSHGHGLGAGDEVGDGNVLRSGVGEP